MPTLSKIMLGVSLLLTVSSIRDEIRGETIFYSPDDTSASYVPQHASQSDAESNFRGAMIYQWVFAIGFAIAGGVGLVLHRHYDRLDPLSSDFRYPNDDDPSSR